MKKIVLLMMMALAVFSLFAEGTRENFEAKDPNTESGVKYVFMFIGDGMSSPEINAAQVYNGSNTPGLIVIEPLTFTQFPVVGIQYTQDATSFCPDSASTATSLSSGYKTHSGVIGLGIDKSTQGETIAEKLKREKDWKIGVVSSVTINHATPAAYYAHVVSRNSYYDIGLQMAESGFDYFAGGLVNKAEKEGEKSIYEVLEDNGYLVSNDRDTILSLNNKSGKVYAYTSTPQDSGSLTYRIDRKEGELSLADYVRKGIDVLYNENGFFLMCEGGKIDWAGHANDALANIGDTLDLDDAVKVAFDFALQHPSETLIIVTGDHETGGMTIGYAATGYNTAFDILRNQKCSYVAFDSMINAEKKNGTYTFDRLMEIVNDNFGLWYGENGTDSALALNDYEYNKLKKAYEDDLSGNAKTGYEESSRLYGGYNAVSVTLTHIINNKAGIGWTSFSHTGLPVPVYAYGVGSEAFSGSYDNTEVAKKLFALCDVE